MRYVDLMGGVKPYLLTGMSNNLGARTQVGYTSSTRFYLADRAAGRPWVTRLPFPVHVVDQVEVSDLVSDNRFATRYAYHHGYFDPVEREFRGFGMVEQQDTQEITALGDAANADPVHALPPVLTRTWFHTGAPGPPGGVSRQFEPEYYREPGLTDAQAESMLLPDTALPDTLLLASGGRVPYQPLPQEDREAARALKGSVLRQELYAIDGGDRQDLPYQITETAYTIEQFQPLRADRHAVYAVHPRETLTLHHERVLPADPRVTHEVTLEVNAYLDVLRSVSLAYPRRHPDPAPDLDPATRDALHAAQGAVLPILTERTYTSPVADGAAHRGPHPADSRTFELINIRPRTEPDVTPLFGVAELRALVDAASDGANDLPCEDVDHLGATTPAPYRRLIGQRRVLYRRDDLTAPLPLGELQSRALPFQQYALAFTPGLIASAGLDPLLTDPAGVLGTEGGYLPGDTAGAFPPGDPKGQWWVPSGQVGYSPGLADTPAQELAYARAHFFLPNRFSDPFGNTTVVTYDRYDLLAAQSSDPLGNTVTAGTRTAEGTVADDGRDYRVVGPRLIADANRNRSAVACDALGMVVATAIMGKPERPEGDSLDGLEPDPDDAVVAAHLADPLTDPYSILGSATTRLVYDLFAYQRTAADPRPQPACVYTLARETHAADLTAGAQPRVQHSFGYTDGFGRTIQHKAQAEPGPVADGGPLVSPRWVGSGWTVYDNKGHPVRQYEPFFTATHRFEFGLAAGVSPVLCYDPVGRLIATLHPNDTYQKVVFDPWRQISFDVNDTVLLDPRADTDVAAYLSGYLDTRPGFQTWYAQRQSGGLGAAEQDAAAKAAAHADTPTVAYADSLGRPVVTVAHNRLVRPGLPAVESAYSTRVVLDILGSQRTVIDPLGRTAQSSVFDAARRVLLLRGADAGDTRTVPDAAGKPIRTSDSRGHTTRTTYDPLRRPLRTYVRAGSGAEALRERTVYGEAHPNAIALNLLTRVHQHYDDSGVVLGDAHDFKGNPLRATRRLAAQYRGQGDWMALDGQADAQLVAALPESLLTSDVFLTSTAYDALNRPASVTSPDGSVYRPTYNEASLLETVDVALAGETRNGQQVWTPFVTDLDYNAKGQRTLLACANGTRTGYTYDPITFRLTGIRTSRGPGNSADCQNLAYTYDPVGNITQLADAAQQIVFFNNAVVIPDADYAYDAVYRLVTARGREHIGQATAPQPTWDDAARTHLPQPGDGQAMRRYTQTYDYDPAGNLGRLAHQATAGNWTRTFRYAEPSPLGTAETSNRLSSSAVGGNAETFTYDAHGNLTSMPHLPAMGWDDRDRLHSADRGGGGTVYCTFDAADVRVRKIVERQNGTRQYERLYLGTLEIYREYDRTGDVVTLERHTLHVMDDQRRIALVETRTIGADPAPAKLVRYQYGNHLDSACLELDDAAAVISYEEYHPYGTTSYQAVRAQTDTPKRYRYTGKERDEETGLTYHGARYYAPWLCRWVSPDPAPAATAVNRYEYVGGRPTRMTDPNGRWGIDMHFVAVYWTGRLEGASHADALHAALASQSLDDYSATAAPAMKLRGALEKIGDSFGGGNEGTVITNGANYSHALNVTKEESLYLAKEGALEKSPILMGLGMHAEGDYLPHMNLTGRSTTGHEQGRNEDLSPSSWTSTYADETMRNPMKALATFQQLRSTWRSYTEGKGGSKAVDLQALSHFIYAENPDFGEHEKEAAWQQGLASAGATRDEIADIIKFVSSDNSKDERKKAWEALRATAKGQQAVAEADHVWYTVLPGRRPNGATINNTKMDMSSELRGLPNIGVAKSFLDRQRYYRQSIERSKTAPDRGNWF
jgi:RHS repeat-associated protein